jgi:crotonobetainyl-CoA:carnitine CoA-transferase CaiB-like acyl-CoA transferase
MSIALQPSNTMGPLEGIRVLDLSRLVAGNMLSLQLADFGAEVIKIESPEGGDTLRHWRKNGLELYWKVYGRNKKSVRLSLKSAADRSLLVRLSRTAQVLIESFRPGVMEALHLAPATLLEINPRIVIVRISGWGQTGPYRNRPGFGSLAEAMCGFAAKNGFPDKPPVLPSMALADMVAGLQGAYATMVALREAERPSGRGQVIDLSLLEPLHSILGPDAAAYRLAGTIPPRSGNRSSNSAPRSVFATSDGGCVALSASTQDMAERLFQAIGHPELVQDVRFCSNTNRLENVEALEAIIQDFISRRTLRETLDYFEAADVTVGPVYDAAQFESDIHVKERGVLVEVPDRELDSMPMHAVVPRLSNTPGSIRRPAPQLGEHDEEILGPLRRQEHEEGEVKPSNQEPKTISNTQEPRL